LLKDPEPITVLNEVMRTVLRSGLFIPYPVRNADIYCTSAFKDNKLFKSNNIVKKKFKVLVKYCDYCTEKKIKFSSYIGTFRVEQLQSHI
jgi:hypothetical protein